MCNTLSTFFSITVETISAPAHSEPTAVWQTASLSSPGCLPRWSCITKQNCPFFCQSYWFHTACSCGEDRRWLENQHPSMHGCATDEQNESFDSQTAFLVSTVQCSLQSSLLSCFLRFPNRGDSLLLLSRKNSCIDCIRSPAKKLGVCPLRCRHQRTRRDAPGALPPKLCTHLNCMYRLKSI